MSGPLNVEGARVAATTTDDLSTFVADIEALVAVEREPHRIASGVQARLPRLLANPIFLAPEYREPWPDRYRPHLLAIAPSGRFSVVALVWLPGQITPIHDHICWCVVGVLQGLERERRYTLHEDATGARWLVPLAEEAVAPGHTCALVPPDENIHQVRNAGDGLAISIHVYGDDLTAHPSSINQCFDEVPIRPGDLSGSAVAWRRVASV
jgi:predicted metal-dependent enzyme (double-stranded beta helix superfamily)